nr:MAG: putative viral replication protein [Ulva CRESS virus 2]
MPTTKEILLEYPALYARYSRACVEYAEALIPPPRLTATEPREGWQRECAALFSEDTTPDPRRVNFYVDDVGNTGKTWMCQYAVTNYPDKVQVLTVGKREDLAYAVDIEKTVFLFDVPRDSMTYLSYQLLEMLKNRMVFSPKYASRMKILRSVPTVIVFSNEPPEMTKMSADRYYVTNI